MIIHSVLHIVKSSILKRTIIYTFSASLNAMVAFLLLPVLTRYLSPYDYGIVETFMAVTALLTGVVMVGSTTLLSKEYFLLDVSDLQIFTSNMLGLIHIVSLFLFIVFLVSTYFTGFISTILKLDNNVIICTIFVSFATACISLKTTNFQLEKKAISYGIFYNSKSLLEISLSLLLIIAIGLKWEGRIGGIVIINMLYLLLVYYLFGLRNIKIVFPNKYYRHILRLGLPMVMAHASVWVYGMVDKIMISNIINIESTGLYSVGYRFGMVVNLIESSFSIAWLPFFFENIKSDSQSHVNKIKIVKGTYIYISLLIVFSLFFGLFGEELLYFMVDKQFYDAGKFILIISLAFCFGGISKMFVGYLITSGKTKTYSYITFLAAVVNIILNYVLLKTYGVIGSAWAMLITMGFTALLTIYVSSRVFKMPWGFFWGKQRVGL